MKKSALDPVWIALLLLGAGSCAAPQTTSKLFQPAAGPVPVPAQDARLSIRHYEYMRQDGGGFLQYQLAKGSPQIRLLAAQALGSLPFPQWGARVSTALCAALRDEDPLVRSAAAFGLGIRADPQTLAALCAAEPVEKHAQVRARRVEAASRFDDDAAREFVFTALQDREPAVVCEAVLGIARWKKDAKQWTAAESRLIGIALDSHSPEDCRWRALFALARQRSGAAERAYSAAAALPDARARIYAAQGLGFVRDSAQATAVLAGLLKDSDWRVVCEAALGLGRHSDEAALDALLVMTGHASAHVRRVQLEALGNFAAQAERVQPALEAARSDDSVNVRAAAIESGAKLLKAGALGNLEGLASSDEARIRLAVATGLVHLPATARVELALALAQDSDLRVRAAAHEALLGVDDLRATAAIEQCWRSGDNGVRLALSTRLEESASAEDLPGMRECFANASGDIAPELKRSLLKACARIGGDQASSLIQSALADPDRSVRQLAQSLGGANASRLVSEAPAERDFSALEELPEDPEVEIVTSRGTLRFRLLSRETPLHVHNFLALARRGEYENTLFHRVVPDFVIQGGDYRGDGNGGRTFDAGPLPAEFRPRKFLRGALGMPRNDEVDSGGSQIFVTHRETPHLDGRYTLFGELVGGFEVLDAIEVGDRILSVRERK
jgi:cyclophilin family peptidyl-prolyl cis-trans isomerase/HEAT repeat protein